MTRTIDRQSLGCGVIRARDRCCSTESAKLRTLANILAFCVNSDGSVCGPLFNAAIVAGTTPTNTFDAALEIVRNPGSNAVAVFDLAPSQAPFQPSLTSAPNYWTMSVTYGGCSPGCGGLNQPGALAACGSQTSFSASERQ